MPAGCMLQVCDEMMVFPAMQLHAGTAFLQYALALMRARDRLAPLVLHFRSCSGPFTHPSSGPHQTPLVSCYCHPDAVLLLP